HVYEELYRRISRDKDSEYAPSLEQIKRTLIFHLVQYGTYLKTVYQKDDKIAEKALNKATRYEQKLSIVHYRLGFLHYKEKKYTKSLECFQNALRFQQKSSEKYKLNEQQLYNCHLYLANCG